MLSDQREFASVDEYGMDPLLDDSYAAILAVSSSTSYTVKAQDQYNPALIAFTQYRDVRWWRAIMIYNRLDDLWDLKEGMRIALPNVNEMTTRLQKLKSATASNNVVTI